MRVQAAEVRGCGGACRERRRPRIRSPAWQRCSHVVATLGNAVATRPRPLTSWAGKRPGAFDPPRLTGRARAPDPLPALLAPLLPPEAERLDLTEAARILGRSLKATRQLAARGTLKTAREIEPGATRAKRIITTRAWIEEYLEGQREPASPPASRSEREPGFLFAEPAWPRPGKVEQPDTRRRSLSGRPSRSFASRHGSRNSKRRSACERRAVCFDLPRPYRRIRVASARPGASLFSRSEKRRS